MDYLRNNYQQDIGLNSSYFSKLFKEEMDISYTDYLNRVGIEVAKKYLQENNRSLVDIAGQNAK